MTQEQEFEEQVEVTLKNIRDLLITKGKEYRRNNNPYYNFEVGARITGETPEKVLHGFLLKHLVSMADIRNDISSGIEINPDKVEEKWDDALVYLIIEKAMILSRIENQK